LVARASFSGVSRAHTGYRVFSQGNKAG
jgi:hypothetical protein